MKLTIIEAGQPPASIRDEWPDYPAMFDSLLSPHMPGLSVEAVPVSETGDFPDPTALDAVLVTGSAAGVYDDHPWMEPLFRFIRACADHDVPQIGICFGHQAIARAFGARVEKSGKGWGIGRDIYDVCLEPAWMASPAPEQFSLAISHKDQVLSLPEGAVKLAASDFCAFAAIDYPDAPALSFQGHPEFSAGFCSALYRARRDALTQQQIELAEQSLETEVDNELVARWMADFLKQNRR